MEAIKIVIFDFDGVVFDSWQTSYKIIKFLTKFSDYSEDDIKKMWGMRAELFIKILIRKIPWPINFLIKKMVYWIWRFQEIRNNPKSKFFNEVLTAIEKLKQSNYLVGILTNRTTKTLKPTLKCLPKPINHYFDFIQTLEFSKKNKEKIHCINHITSLHPKPNVDAFVDLFCKFIFPELIKHKKNNQNYPKVELYYIGDTLTDLEFVKNCNKNLNFQIIFYVVLTGPLDSKDKWINWSTGQIKEENVLNSIADLINKLKIPQ